LSYFSNGPGCRVGTNKYLYNGKELIEENGLQYYDYGARMYDPVLGRWGVVDPLAEAYFDYSSYNYTLNNPIKFVDPNGMWVENAESFSTDEPDEIKQFLGQYQNKDPEKKIYEGKTLDEVTVTAPRSFDGVLGTAANRWKDEGKNYSTYGNIGFNNYRINSTTITLFNGSGFYLNGITPLVGIAIELEKIRYTGVYENQVSDWFFTARFGWGLDVGPGVMVTKYNSQSGILLNENIQGLSVHASILNYQNTQSINYDAQRGLVIGQTSGHSMSFGLSPASPVKLYGSLGVGYTFNISKFRRDHVR